MWRECRDVSRDLSTSRTAHHGRWLGEPTPAGPPLQFFAHDPIESGLFGFRARAIDLIGDAQPDIVFVGLGNRNSYVWDTNDLQNSASLPAPPNAFDHWAEGISYGQIVPGGKEEVVFGSPRWEPEGIGNHFNSGRVMIMSLD